MDDSEFEAFATTRATDLYRSAWLLTGERGAAEDLVQETLARTFARWERIRSTQNPAAYVQTVLFRIFVTGRRRFSASEQPVAEVPDGSVVDPDVGTRLALVAALAQLDRKDRAVLVLRYLHDQDVATVAAALGLTENAVRSRASRSLAKVRTHLGAEFLTTTGDPS